MPNKFKESGDRAKKIISKWPKWKQEGAKCFRNKSYLSVVEKTKKLSKFDLMNKS